MKAQKPFLFSLCLSLLSGPACKTGGAAKNPGPAANTTAQAESKERVVSEDELFEHFNDIYIVATEADLKKLESGLNLEYSDRDVGLISGGAAAAGILAGIAGTFLVQRAKAGKVAKSGASKTEAASPRRAESTTGSGGPERPIRPEELLNDEDAGAAAAASGGSIVSRRGAQLAAAAERLEELGWDGTTSSSSRSSSSASSPDGREFEILKRFRLRDSPYLKDPYAVAKVKDSETYVILDAAGRELLSRDRTPKEFGTQDEAVAWVKNWLQEKDAQMAQKNVQAFDPRVQRPPLRREGAVVAPRGYRRVRKVRRGANLAEDSSLAPDMEAAITALIEREALRYYGSMADGSPVFVK